MRPGASPATGRRAGGDTRRRPAGVGHVSDRSLPHRPGGPPRPPPQRVSCPACQNNTQPTGCGETLPDATGRLRDDERTGDPRALSRGRRVRTTAVRPPHPFGADGMTHGLQMPPDVMRELAAHVTEILVRRNVRLPDDRAWDGEFKQELAERLMEDPPEAGRPPREVIDRAVREVLSPAMRLDHPRAFGFIPSEPTWPGVLADYLATGFNVNAATWLTASGPSQLEAVVVDWFRRWVGYPRHGGRRDDQRRLGGRPRRLRGGARGGGAPAAGHRLHGRPEPQRAGPRRPHHRYPPRPHSRAANGRRLPRRSRCPGRRRRGRPGGGMHARRDLRRRRLDQHRRRRSA